MLVNSLESLGFLPVFKAYHQIVSVPETMTIEKFAFPSASDVQCRDRRRLDPSMRIVPGTDCAALRYETKKPPACAGGSCQCSRVAAYRLAWRLAPPPGPLSGPLPRMSPLETSLTQSEPLPL